MRALSISGRSPPKLPCGFCQLKRVHGIRWGGSPDQRMLLGGPVRLMVQPAPGFTRICLLPGAGREFGPLSPRDAARLTFAIDIHRPCSHLHFPCTTDAQPAAIGEPAFAVPIGSHTRPPQVIPGSGPGGGPVARSAPLPTALRMAACLNQRLGVNGAAAARSQSQQVTWNRPRRAPRAWFQAPTAWGVGSSVTRHAFFW